jgi:hypothetical protein
MPWWSWILLWVALAALSLLFIAFLGWRVFRGFTATMRELAAAESGIGSVGRTAAAEPGPAAPAAEPAVSIPAIFADPEAARLNYDAGKQERTEARRLRRVARRAERGQPQSLRDLRL